MSILICGMEMPKDCALLLKIFSDGRVGVPVHLNWAGTMVVNDAEAIPVPPHGRCIDADALMELYADTDDLRLKDMKVPIAVIRQNIMDMPTIIPAEEDE